MKRRLAMTLTLAAAPDDCRALLGQIRMLLDRDEPADRTNIGRTVIFLFVSDMPSQRLLDMYLAEPLRSPLIEFASVCDLARLAVRATDAALRGRLEALAGIPLPPSRE